jgi:hypothetical protein
MDKQFYLAEMDPADNPIPIDGPFAGPREVADAARMHRGASRRRFKCARIELSDLDTSRREVPALQRTGREPAGVAG